MLEHNNLSWKKGPIPDHIRNALVCNIYGEYEVGRNIGDQKISYEHISGDLYRKKVTHIADWNGIHDMGNVVAWAELPDPKDVLK